MCWYQSQLLPGHLKALKAFKVCRTVCSPVMKVQCTDCGHQAFAPHSCGHRNCPHCQHHDKSSG
ncbi:MAG TPA: hypothetical protein ENJ82_17575 [Bacteroidetes bacterium]|nr:hypothetical protein [Bacteroidota bacterium]